VSVDDNYVVLPGLGELRIAEKEEEKNIADESQVKLQVMKQVLADRKGLSSYKTWLYQTGTSTSSAATAQNLSQTIQPVSATEFSSFANLFDEARCIGLEFWASVYATGAANTSVIECAMAFDPANNGAYSEPAQMLNASQHRYWILNPVVGGGADQAVTSRGLHTLKVRIPKGDSLPGSTSGFPAIVFGSWFPCTATAANAVVGFAKFSIDPPSVGTTVLTYGWRMQMEFRSRT
jgi:hypothetical protein